MSNSTLHTVSVVFPPDDIRLGATLIEVVRLKLQPDLPRVNPTGQPLHVYVKES